MTFAFTFRHRLHMPQYAAVFARLLQLANHFSVGIQVLLLLLSVPFLCLVRLVGWS